MNRFDEGIGTIMRKATHPSGGMGSSNPRRWRGERLHHHGDGVCHVVCAFCAVSDSWLVSCTRHTYLHFRGVTKWPTQACTIPFWKRGRTTIFDVQICDTDAKSYGNRTSKKVLESASLTKKSKFEEACLERHRDFTPMLYSVDDMADKHAHAAEKRTACILKAKWIRQYSQMASFVQTWMCLAIVRSKTPSSWEETVRWIGAGEHPTTAWLPGLPWQFGFSKHAHRRHHMLLAPYLSSHCISAFNRSLSLRPLLCMDGFFCRT